MIAAIAFIAGAGCGFVLAVVLLNLTSEWSIDDER